jgi:lipopolysaccharide transport system permease protein
MATMDVTHRTVPAWNPYLLAALVKRDFRAQYRRSLIGPAWALLYTLIYLGLFVAVRSFLGIPSNDQPYVLFAAVSIVPWTFFSGAVSRAGASIMLNGSLIKKMAVRREVFPAAAVVLSFGDLLIASMVLVVLAGWYDVSIGWAVLWTVPLLLLLALLAYGVGMAVAAVGVYKRDVIFALPFAIQIWMLASPIMYPLSVVPEQWQALYALNPAVGIIEGLRAALLHNSSPDTGLLFSALVGTAVLLSLGSWLFRSLSQYFVDVL